MTPLHMLLHSTQLHIGLQTQLTGPHLVLLNLPNPLGLLPTSHLMFLHMLRQRPLLSKLHATLLTPIQLLPMYQLHMSFQMVLISEFHDALLAGEVLLVGVG